MNEVPIPPPAPSPTSNRGTTPSLSGEGARIPFFETMDRLERAMAARLTQGVSPARALRRMVRLGIASCQCARPAPGIGDRGREYRRAVRAVRHKRSPDRTELPFPPQEGDRRFTDPAWGLPPYVLWQQAFLAQEAWWQCATREVRGMTPKNAARARLHDTPIAGRVVARECALAQSSDHRADDQGIRRQSRARRDQFPG